MKTQLTHWHLISNLFGENVVQFTSSCPRTAWVTPSSRLQWQGFIEHSSSDFGIRIHCFLIVRIDIRPQKRALGIPSILCCASLVLERIVTKLNIPSLFDFQLFSLGERGRFLFEHMVPKPCRLAVRSQMRWSLPSF